MSTAAPSPEDDHRRPAGPPTAWVAQMARSLDFYLDLGCAVRSAADGWALLSCGRVSFVLVKTPDETLPGRRRRAARPSASGSPMVRLPVPDVEDLRRRLLDAGARPTPAPDGAFEITDPDGHTVVVAPAGPPGDLPRGDGPVVARRSLPGS